MKQMEGTKLPISVAIITKNEEEKLRDCLESIAFIEDIVVVDSGSSDRTVEIAASYGARVFEEPWRGFSDQKQFAIDQAKYDWVLLLDADERSAYINGDAICRTESTPRRAAEGAPRLAVVQLSGQLGVGR